MLVGRSTPTRRSSPCLGRRAALRVDRQADDDRPQEARRVGHVVEALVEADEGVVGELLGHGL
jgi:hypothetical protein